MLIQKLDNMIDELKQSHREEICCLAVILIGIFFIPVVKDRYKVQIEKLEDAKTFAQIRKDADGPDAALNLPEKLKKCLEKHKMRIQPSDDGAVYYNNIEYYGFVAAACGACDYGDGG